MRRALSSTSASNELMRRCLLRWQDERLFPTFCVFGHLCYGFSPNERFLRVLTTIYLQRRYQSGVQNFFDVPGKPMEHTQTNRSPPEPPGRPLAIAKTGVMISNRGSSVSGAAALAGSRCASGCGTATAVRVWRRRWRLRRVWRWAARGYAGSWRIVRPRVAVPGVGVSHMDSG